ncbi:MAG: sigma-70 family RNA polymerase sigma factor [Verrucomicrobia bacterium]|nr:sigma-70 family RNA polymerase sigma factor [Verrucomicrobiota bacterium]MCG2679782.1 sigma-70 family RNA polymerase sigma factor [Kiritimatiellia bacterium]MBU4247101.1 sigma-70 family RNA polymerase sigma factor [Verrucomicrobiota bacterium]MBU4289987.1 sigma-70 family RNA polymerase sigma factor [Verrucomicrobiota bacterium]MBU4428650.1 sigma-70 family RNA polymerase sigma factor [Verrucomicrobiota bacterium]
MEDSDSDLLVQYRNGSVQALEQLVERYRRPLFGFILNMSHAREEADDIFQEVWFRAIKSLDRYRDERFLSWLFRIARNLVIDRYRSRKPLVSLESENPEGVALEDVIPDQGRSAAALAADHDVARQVATAVATLPEEQKEVFLMRLEGELSFKEIAKIQHVSINTALARMHYALAKLRDMLK